MLEIISKKKNRLIIQEEWFNYIMQGSVPMRQPRGKNACPQVGRQVREEKTTEKDGVEGGAKRQDGVGRRPVLNLRPRSPNADA